MTIEHRLTDAGFILPEPAAPVASYLPTRRVGQQMIVSGQLSIKDGALITGHLGTDAEQGGSGILSVEEGAAAAAACGLMLLAQVRAALGGELDRLKGCLRLGGFVAATASFTDHPKVINGASDLMLTALGEEGRHARAAVGVASLPLGAAVEVEGLFLIQE